jgi:hypothetical protein
MLYIRSKNYRFGIIVLLAIAVEMIYQHVLGVKICSVEMLLSQWPILLITLFSGLFGTTVRCFVTITNTSSWTLF